MAQLSQNSSKLNEIERIIERGVSIEETNGSLPQAIGYYKDAKDKINQLLQTRNVDQETLFKLKKYTNLINERITANSASTYSANRSVSSGTEFLKKYASYLRKFDKKFVEEISFNIMQPLTQVKFDDVAGNSVAKDIINESIILPTLKPELFQGLRRPVRGILLYGPPGNGKTLLAKAISNQCNSTFFCISAANLMSKWVGESEKLVSTLFACARVASPSIIFIDEVDALLSNREQGSNQVQFRLLTQFLQEVDGVQSGDQQLLVLAATNHPEVLDDAALRRFPRRIYIGMPDNEGRKMLIDLLMKKEKQIAFSLKPGDVNFIVNNTNGYSSSDLTELVKDAAMGPIRGVSPEKLIKLGPQDLRPVSLADFRDSMQRIRPSVDSNSLAKMLEWRSKFGDQLSTPTQNSNSSIFSYIFPSSSSSAGTQKNVIYKPSTS